MKIICTKINCNLFIRYSKTGMTISPRVFLIVYVFSTSNITVYCTILYSRLYFHERVPLHCIVTCRIRLGSWYPTCHEEYSNSYNSVNSYHLPPLLLLWDDCFTNILIFPSRNYNNICCKVNMLLEFKLSI